jgi:hypothetical protein
LLAQNNQSFTHSNHAISRIYVNMLINSYTHKDYVLINDAHTQQFDIMNNELMECSAERSIILDQEPLVLADLFRIAFQASDS